MHALLPYYDLSGLDVDDERKRKEQLARRRGLGGAGGGGGGCVAQRHAACASSDVEAILTPDQRRPSDAAPPDWNDIRPLPSNNGGSGAGRGGRPDPHEERLQRELDERARFLDEIGVRAQLDDVGAHGARCSGGDLAKLDAEEKSVKTRIGHVEDRINTILHQPLGADGLGVKKVWRMRSTAKIWSETVGDRRTSEVIMDTASGVAMCAKSALQGTAHAVSSGASRVASWSYKPALWSAGELVGDTVSVAATSALTAASAVGRGLYMGANSVVETVDENTAELEQLQSELSLLSDKLGAIDAQRSNASIRLTTPHEGSVWYINHACNVDWESSGVIQEVRISIARRMTSLFSWTELARGVPDAGSWSYIVPPSLDRGWYCIRIEGPMGVPSCTSAFFLIEHEVPPLTLWVEDQRLHYHRSEKCRIHWAFRDDGGAVGNTVRRQHAAHPYEQSVSGRAPAELGGSGEDDVRMGADAGGASAIHGVWDGGNKDESWVKLYLKTGLLQWRVLADNLPTSGSFDWIVPEACTQGAYQIQAKLKGAAAARWESAVRAKSSSGLVGLPRLGGAGASSSALLSPVVRLHVRDELCVLAPSAGTVWRVGALELISWRCRGAGRDDLSIHIGSRFLRYATVAVDQPDTGSLYWAVPEDMAPGWYYLSLSAPHSQVAVQSEWIKIVAASGPPACAEGDRASSAHPCHSSAAAGPDVHDDGEVPDSASAPPLGDLDISGDGEEQRAVGRPMDSWLPAPRAEADAGLRDSAGGKSADTSYIGVPCAM